MKKFKLLMIVAIVLLCLTGCGKEEVKKKVETKKDAVEGKVQIIDLENKERPYAVMINTHNEALPQSGLQNAYIVYELMVEGGITRMMALFKEVDVDKIGSVRSARTQYLGYAYEHDAIYVHAGGANDALSRISNEGINDVDVDGQYGVRDTNLNRAWEHTLFTTTDLLNKAVSNRSIRTEVNVENLLNYQADSIDFSKFKDVKEANSVSIKYSDYRTSEYKYDENKKMYLRSMNGNPNNDLVSGEQYEVKNIIVYGVYYTNYCDSGYCAYQKIDNIGTGEGYYISEGHAIPITWVKENEKAQTVYTVKETGKELVVNDGNTYIQIYPTSGNLSIN